MKQIRHGVFETNSSSTHSLAIMHSDEFELFREGKLIWDRETETFLPSETVKVTDDINDDDIFRYETYEEYQENVEYEITKFTTRAGEKLVILYGERYE